MQKFNKAKTRVSPAIMSDVDWKPYMSVNLPPITGAIADPRAKAMFWQADALSAS